MAHGNNRGKETRIVVVHVNKMFRELLARRLSELGEFRVVSEAGSVKDARSVIADARPDIVLIGFSLPDGSGTDAAQELAKEYPEAKWIILASRLRVDNLAQAISVGVSGCVFETCSLEELVSSLREVADGGYAFDISVLVDAVRECARCGIPHDISECYQSISNLSPREQEILDLVSKGLTNKEIATAAYLSINTVKTHLRRIYQELGVNSRREIARSMNAQMH
ncbi:response regulator transcription factor [bacterium]|nr:response regulator transcription factor [bacterium]